MRKKRFLAILNFFNKISGLIYIWFILSVGHFNANYVVTDSVLRVILLILYFLISAMFIFGMFRSKDHIINRICGAALPFAMFVFMDHMDHPVFLIPVIGIFIYFIYLRKSHFLYFIGTTAIIGIIFLCFVFFYLLFLNFGEDTTLAQIPSPSGQYVLISVEHDEGALGGGVTVTAKKEFHSQDLLTFYKKGNWFLYGGDWGEKPNVAWIDDCTISVNGRMYKLTD
jgi:hypothetical protein